MESKLKHLEMIQAVINRMASNSFVFKGWSVSIIAGLSEVYRRWTRRRCNCCKTKSAKRQSK